MILRNRHTIRLHGYDYAQNGWYFVTVCIQNRLHILGTVGADPCVRPMDPDRPIIKNNRPTNLNIDSIDQNIQSNNPNIRPINKMQLNDIGTIIEKWWLKIVEKYPGVEIDVYQIMPNHVHGIVIIAKNVDHTNVDMVRMDNMDVGRTHGCAPTNSGSNPTLGNIIQWFKTMTTNEYLRGVKSNGWERVDGRLWQRNYYEHIIRNEK